MFGQTLEYALRAALHLARTHDEPQTARQIAGVMQVPSSYLSKVMRGLARAGIVHSQRGVGGGFVLTRPPEAITLLEIVDAVQPLQRIETCPLGVADHDVGLCPLHRRLDAAIAHVRDAFGSTTLGELRTEPNPCATLEALESSSPPSA